MTSTGGGRRQAAVSFNESGAAIALRAGVLLSLGTVRYRESTFRRGGGTLAWRTLRKLANTYANSEWWRLAEIALPMLVEMAPGGLARDAQ
jgi:hypothetical protein